MSFLGTFVRRNFEPLMLSVQVLLDLAVVLFACWLGYHVGGELGSLSGEPAQREMYREISALIAAVCLVTFHACGLYSPVKSLLNMEEYKALLKSTVIAFFVLLVLLVYLRNTRQTPDGPLGFLASLHEFVDLRVNVNSISRVTLLATFVFVLVFMTAARFASFKVIQRLHQQGIGNRNVLIYGAGDTGRRLQRKFHLVPTLGVNLVGYCDDDPREVGKLVDRVRVLGTSADLAAIVGAHKVSEVFIAMPEAPEERIVGLLTEFERLGVTCHIVPRLWHLMAFNLRAVNVDSIPLFTRATRRPSVLQQAGKRLVDIAVSLAVVLLAAPLFFIAALLIRRESPGPIFFQQERIGKDGRPFRMLKFRTMHQHLSGDAPTPRSSEDPRITRIGKWLRRFSLDELPQFVNVLRGEMSVVGPRPEMRFIVAGYGALERERLRVKPGITGLWQISYARQMAIHENLDYDLYYIEHESLLLDLVIIALTAFAVVKGTGAY